VDRTLLTPATPERSRAAAGKPWLLHPAVKPVALLLCLLPLALLVGGAVMNTLGPNPAEALIRQSGDWTLRFLCLTLAITPLRLWLHQPALLRLRRMLGVSAFGYGLLHFLCYAWLDKSLDVADILRDIAKRPFILVGTAALLLMLPLALTSFNRAIKALGGKRWQALHRAVYAVAGLGLLHFFWMRSAKHDLGEVAVYGAIIAVLLAERLRRRLMR
jgi:sulfoxide reductase heme-binding subunit YedZ